MDKFQLCMESVKTLMGESWTSWYHAVKNGHIFRDKDQGHMVFSFMPPRSSERLIIKRKTLDEIRKFLEHESDLNDEDLTQAMAYAQSVTPSDRPKPGPRDRPPRRVKHMGGTEEDGDNLRRAMRRSDGPMGRNYGRRRTI